MALHCHHYNCSSAYVTPSANGQAAVTDCTSELLPVSVCVLILSLESRNSAIRGDIAWGLVEDNSVIIISYRVLPRERQIERYSKLHDAEVAEVLNE